MNQCSQLCPDRRCAVGQDVIQLGLLPPATELNTGTGHRDRDRWAEPFGPHGDRRRTFEPHALSPRPHVRARIGLGDGTNCFCGHTDSPNSVARLRAPTIHKSEHSGRMAHLRSKCTKPIQRCQTTHRKLLYRSRMSTILSDVQERLRTQKR